MMNYNPFRQEFVDKMVVGDQTEMVNTLLSVGSHKIVFGEEALPGYDNIVFPEVFVPRIRKLEDLEEEEEEERPEIYSWKLINPWYVDIVEEGDMPYLQYKGQTWLGKTMTNCLTEWQYLKDYISKNDEKYS